MNGGKTGEAGQLFQSALSVVVTRTTRPRIWPPSGASLPAGGRHSSRPARPAAGAASAWRPDPCRAAATGANDSSAARAALDGRLHLEELVEVGRQQHLARRESVNGLNAGFALNVGFRRQLDTNSPHRR